MAKDIVIFSNKIAYELIKAGYKLQAIKENYRVKNQLVYYFENTQALKDELAETYDIVIKEA